MKQGGSSTTDILQGTDIYVGPQYTAHPPPGLLTDVFNRFVYCIVVGCELTMTIKHTGPLTQANDVMMDVALTPASENELALVQTAAPWIYGPSPASKWIGTNAVDQWNTCRNMQGTIVKRLDEIGASKRNVVTLHKKMSMDWFNTEPLWQGFNANYCTNKIIPPATTVAGQANLAVGYRNYIVYTQYQSAGNTNSSGSTYLSYAINQKWFVKCFEPIPPPLVT